MEKQKLQSQLKEAALEAAKMREATAKSYREQDWQRVQTGLLSGEDDDESEEEEEEDAEAEGGENGVEDDDSATGETDDEKEDGLELPDWYCAACEKEFASQGAWDNHERSKKHQKNVDRLVREMQDEDEEFGLSRATFEQQLSLHQQDGGLDDAEDHKETPPKLSKKEKKKLKRRAEMPWDLPQEKEEAEVLEPATASEAMDASVQGKKGSAVETDLKTQDGQSSEHEDASEDVTAQEPVQMSKRDKRRAKEAAKKAASAAASGTSTPAEVSQRRCPSRVRGVRSCDTGRRD